MRKPNRLPIYPLGTKGVTDVIYLEDNEKIHFGTGEDIAIYWDGTNLLFNPATGQTMTIKFESGITTIHGGTAAGDDLYLYPSTSVTKPSIQLLGNSTMYINAKAGSPLIIRDNVTQSFNLQYVSNVSTLSGGAVSGDDLKLEGSTTDDYPYILLSGNSRINLVHNSQLDITHGAGLTNRFLNGTLHLKETSTPTAIADFGAIYTKNDNLLYFQDGAGTEHTVAFA